LLFRLGGYFGVGWLTEIYTLPGIVRDANEDPKFIKEFIEKLRSFKKPQFSTNRFLGAIMVGYLWGQVAMIAIPEEDLGGINWSYLHWVSHSLISFISNCDF
jgi:DnaJ homolog subfamily C member 22